MGRIFSAIKPDPAVNEFLQVCILFDVIAKKIRSLTPPADISEVMKAVDDLLDRSIAAQGYVISDGIDPFDTSHLVDLSKIDFKKLKAKFDRGRKRIEVEKLRGMLQRKVQAMVRFNRTRIDFAEKFQKMIDEYNAGTLNLEEFFRQLVNFAQSLKDEEKRGIAENLKEEELALFDLLIKPELTLTKKDEQAVKKVAKDLLETLKKEKLVLDWRKRQQDQGCGEAVH